jgi:rubredoxin
LRNFPPFCLCGKEIKKMFKRNHIVKINLPGGIVSAGDLMNIVDAAERSRIQELQFGNRQQLYLKVTDANLPELESALNSSGIFFEVDRDDHPNIVSSYVTEDAFQNSNWLSEDVYKDIIESFNYKPRLKINIVDNDQTFVPLFTGNINFVNALQNNYWHLYIRFPKTKRIYRWPVLIYSFDISRLSELVEQVIFDHADQFYDQQTSNGDILYKLVNGRQTFITQSTTEEPALKEFSLPYYEGFNRYGSKWWLGVYRRDEMFSISFLKDACTVCLQTKVGQIYTTPWKSIIIKHIEQKDRKLWDYVLGKYRINVRHASNELNWQLEDIDEEGLNLKRYLIRQFDKDDVRTFGLCFAIQTWPKSELFGSVIIRKNINDSKNQRKILDRYDLLYTNDFNPNSKELILYRSDVQKENIGTYLISLCKYFYELQSKEELVSHSAYREKVEKQAEIETATHEIHQCSSCLTIYDDRFGDSINDIEPGIKFNSLPDNYTCPTCGNEKKQFVAARTKALKFEI